MAAPGRPSFRINGTNITYQSLDNVDETAYNALQYLYTRAAFIAVVQDRLDRVASGASIAFADGNAIVMEYNSRTRGKKQLDTYKKRKREYRPEAIADPPLVPVPAPPDTPSTLELPQPPDSPHTPTAPPSSPKTLAGGSPRLITKNDVDQDDGVLVSPSRADRESVNNSSQGQGWKYVSVLYQLELKETGVALEPRKNVLLYVRTGSNGLIRDHLVVKCVNCTKKGDVEWVQAEIETSEKLAFCRHVIRYLGTGKRESEKKIRNPEGKIWTKSQNILHIYTEFARYVDLEKIVQAHVAKSQPIPEHFIWHFLSEMTHALEAFQTGNCAKPRTIKEDPDHDLDETPEWQPLLHSDIKLLNIFCCDQNTVYQSYPRPVLADFDRVHTQESADKMRYEGTRDWQPPERYSDCAGDKAYAPHLSPLTVASDIWGVGLIGCRMMWAGEGEKVYNSLRVDLRKTMDTWSQQFKRDEWDNNMGNEGLIDASFPNTPGLYSFGLIRFLQRCLRYKPENRPSLAEMRTTIAENIARLDGLYGDEIMKPKGEIFQHHVVLTDGVPALDALDAFAMGQQYEPPRKRRRINVENEDVATYRQFIAEWVSMESSGPQPSVKQQTEIIENLAKCGRESQTDAIRQSVEYGSLRHTYAYLYNCLLSRVRSEGPYTARRNDIEEEFEESVEPQAKIHVLECLRDHIIPELLDDETIKEDLQPALRVLEHVVRLTLFLQSVNGEPLTPVYPNKTELHRGFVDWLFINPIPGKA